MVVIAIYYLILPLTTPDQTALVSPQTTDAIIGSGIVESRADFTVARVKKSTRTE